MGTKPRYHITHLELNTRTQAAPHSLKSTVSTARSVLLQTMQAQRHAVAVRVCVCVSWSLCDSSSLSWVVVVFAIASDLLL